MADDRLCFSPVLFEFNNHWAEWARGRGLMTYSGKECAPESASLLTAYRQRDARQVGRHAGLLRRRGPTQAATSPVLRLVEDCGPLKQSRGTSRREYVA